MLINIPSGIGGKWLDKKNIVTGDIIKIVTEAQEVANMNNGKSSTQVVAKVLVKGKSKEPENFAINVPSQKALASVFGADSVAWKDKVFTAHVEKTLIAGKRGISVYLIPDGMVMKESDDGYLYIGHVDSSSGTIKSTLTPEQVAQIERLKQNEIDSRNNQSTGVDSRIAPEDQDLDTNDIPF